MVPAYTSSVVALTYLIMVSTHLAAAHPTVNVVYSMSWPRHLLHHATLICFLSVNPSPGTKDCTLLQYIMTSCVEQCVYGQPSGIATAL